MLLLQCVVSYFSARCKLLRFYFSTTPHFFTAHSMYYFSTLPNFNLYFYTLPNIIFSTSYSYYYIVIFMLLPIHCLSILPLCVAIVLCVCVFFQFGHWVCGESWLAIKDSLTHRPSSQGWAPDVLLSCFV